MVGTDGASLVAAAIRAAILAKAPRRTVSAVAAAVTGALVHQRTAPPANMESREPAGNPAGATAVPTGSPAELVAALKEARQVKRRKKKARRRANRDLREGNATAGEDRAEPPAVLAIADTSRVDKRHLEASPNPGGGADALAVLSDSPAVRPPKKVPRAGSAGVASLPPVPPFPSEEVAAEDSGMEAASNAGSCASLKTFSGRSRVASTPADSDMEAVDDTASARRPSASTGGGKPRARRRGKKKI